MSAEPSLIGELESAIQSGSNEKRLETLRRVTNLFLDQHDRLSEKQIAVFDDVLGHIIKRVESKALAELSERLAPIDNAPLDLVKRLANDDKIAVAGPVLTNSTRLATSDLVDIAKTKSQKHLLAISGRKYLEEELTSMLVERGDHAVLHKLSSNPGARFSQSGFAELLRRSEDNEGILEVIGLRPDLPVVFLRELLSKVSQSVRARLLSVANPALRASMESILGRLADAVSTQMARRESAARETVLELNKNGQLNEDAIRSFAAERMQEELSVALGLMTGSKPEVIGQALSANSPEAVLIPCMAAGLSWPTARAVLEMKMEGRSAASLDAFEAAYAKLTVYTAQRTLRFWQVRRSLTAKAS